MLWQKQGDQQQSSLIMILQRGELALYDYLNLDQITVLFHHDVGCATRQIHGYNALYFPCLFMSFNHLNHIVGETTSYLV